MRKVSFVLLLAIALAASDGVHALADDPPQGKVMLTKAAPDALLIWDASPVVAAYTSVSKTPAGQAMRGLESGK
jgi:hypothetical protein